MKKLLLAIMIGALVIPIYSNAGPNAKASDKQSINSTIAKKIDHKGESLIPGCAQLENLVRLNNNILSNLGGVYKENVILNPKRFYIFDNKYQTIKLSFKVDIILEKPLYALVGANNDVKARIIAILRPETISFDGTPTDTWVIALTGSNVNAPKSSGLSGMIITNNYQIQKLSSIPSKSIWNVDHNIIASATLHSSSNAPGDVSPKLWNYNTLGADIPATYGPDQLVISGIILPAFIRLLETHVFKHIYVTGYRPGVDGKISLRNPGGPWVVIDDPAMKKF
ncbi:hypothetical protein ACFL3K_00555 [Pseudomonadota bacterium]